MAEMIGSHVKGVALEDAVSGIETAILNHVAGIETGKFKIESRKIITVASVPHEFDIHVALDAGCGYSSAFVFECKNWAKSVGKNEIMNFAARVDAIQATKGFFVAKSYAKTARAQAKLHPRLTLLRAKEYPVTTTSFPPLDGLFSRPRRVLYQPYDGAGQDVDIDKDRSVIWKGEAMPLERCILALAERATLHHLSEVRNENLPNGDYPREGRVKFTLQPSELLVDGQELGAMLIVVTFIAEIRRMAIVSHFEVEKRGRVITFEPAEVGAGKLQFRVTIVKKDDVSVA